MSASVLSAHFRDWACDETPHPAATASKEIQIRDNEFMIKGVIMIFVDKYRKKSGLIAQKGAD